MGRNQKFFLSEDFFRSITNSSSSFSCSLAANIFPKRLVPDVPNSILRNLPFCSFASFLIVSLTPSNNNPEFSRDLTILKMFFSSKFENIKVVL